MPPRVRGTYEHACSLLAASAPSHTICASQPSPSAALLATRGSAPQKVTLPSAHQSISGSAPRRSLCQLPPAPKVTLYSPSWWAHLWVRPTQRMDWKEPKGKTEKNLPSWWELMVTWVGTVGTEKKSKFKKPQRRHAGPNVGGREDPRCLSWATGLLAAPHRHHSASAAFSGLRNHTLMFASFASDQEHLAQFMSYYPY